MKNLVNSAIASAFVAFGFCASVQANEWNEGDDAYCVYLTPETFETAIWQYKILGIRNGIVQLQPNKGQVEYKEMPLADCYKTKQAAEAKTAFWDNQKALKNRYKN